MNEWDAIKVKRIKRLRQISFPLKPFDHSERERERERNLEGGPDCWSQSRGSNESTADLRWVMTDLSSGIYDLQKFRFIFHFSDSEIKRERKREKYLEGGPEGASEQRPISDLWWGASDDGDDERAAASRRRDRGFAGVWFLFVYWGFFFLDKNLCLSMFSVFLSVCSVFGLLLSLICSIGSIGHWGMLSLPPIWFLCQRRDGWIFWFSVFFFFFSRLRMRGLAVSELLGSPWA